MNIKVIYPIPSAVVLKDFDGKTLPYIAEVDLLVFKIVFTGSKTKQDDKSHEALDAEALVKDLSKNGSKVISLSDKQKEEVKQYIKDVAEHSDEKDVKWWEHALGLHPENGHGPRHGPPTNGHE